MLLRSAGTGRGWHVLEGPTYPDVFVETRDALVVVEGKRTEAGPTTSTSGLRVGIRCGATSMRRGRFVASGQYSGSSSSRAILRRQK